MVFDKVVVVHDFYCNVEDVADNARNQLAREVENGNRTTGGGNMNSGRMQDSFQRYMSHKITDFVDFANDEHLNGCFSCEGDFANFPDSRWKNYDWVGLIFLGFSDFTGAHDGTTEGAGPRGMKNEENAKTLRQVKPGLMLTVGGETNVGLKLNTLVLFRSRYETPPGLTYLVEFDEDATSLMPMFQMFFYNTHNMNFLGQDHYVVLDRLRQIRVLPKVLSAEKCQEYIDIAERWALENNDGSWTRERHSQYPTTDIPVSYLSFNDEIMATVRDKVFPEIAKQFLFPVDSLGFLDFFIVKYDANAQSKLDWHRDVSLISFNFALNADFEGGGTSHPAATEPVRIGTGDVLMHTGKVLHSGNNVTAGVRYIIVGFVKVDSSRVDFDFIKAKSRVRISDDDLFRNILLY